MSLRRMRTILEALEEVKSLDPKTAVTPYCIRMLCKNKRVRCIYTGRKILVDLDDLIGYLNGGGYDAVPVSAPPVNNSQVYAN